MISFDKNHAVVAAIADEMKKQKSLLGRTKVQKLVFLLSELFQAKTDYQFKFYTYGPFSNELAGDIDYHAKIDVLDSIFHLDKGFYEIEPGKFYDEADVHGSLDKQINSSIQSLVSNFGNKTAAELELLSTVVFVNRFDDAGTTLSSLTERTKALKPKFSETDILSAVQSIRDRLTISEEPLTA